MDALLLSVSPPIRLPSLSSLHPNPNPNPNPKFSLSHRPRSSTTRLAHRARNDSKIRSQLAPSTTPTSGAETASVSEKFDWFAQWYPLSPICDLDKRVPHAKTVLGLDVVVWWDRTEEQWRVFDDRCPHRLAPLSEGRIDPRGRLQCVYHGWCFDGAGGCKYIPQAEPTGPPVHTSSKACVAAYPSLVQNKLLWFWPNTDPQYKDISMKKKPPYIQELDDPSYTSTMGIRDLPYGYEVLTENLMDPAHVRYAHRGIMRVPKRQPPPGRVESDREGGVPIDMTIESLDVSGFLSKQQVGYSNFIAPCTYCAAPINSPTDSSLDAQKASSDNMKQKNRLLLVFYCIPVVPGRSRVIWVFPRNFAVWMDMIVPRWMFHVGQNLILDSDLYLLHLEERKILEAGNSNWQKACYVPTKSDAQITAFRRWLKRYAQNQVDWGNKFSGYLPPAPPKEQLMDRYWSHVVYCSSCRKALKGLKALEVVLQVVSVVSIAILAAARQSLVSFVARSAVVSLAVLCFVASKWLSHFNYKNFYFHDYNHAFK